LFYHSKKTFVLIKYSIIICDKKAYRIFCFNHIDKQMKIVYYLIPLFIIYVILILLYFNDFLKDYYINKFKENFQCDYHIDNSLEMATKDEVNLNTQMIKYKNGLNDAYEKITDPINDVYLPYTESSFEDAEINTQNKLNEYVIIDVYKNLLGRQPKHDELNKLLQEFHENDINEETLKMRIYNSTEYKMIVKMQSNDVDAGLISTSSSEDLIDRLKRIYKELKKSDPEIKMLLPLKDCYIHLQFNDYLFMAMLVHNNFGKFETEILDMAMLSREKMLELFDKYFLLSDLRLVANEFKKQEMLKRKGKAIPRSFEIDKGALINSSNMNIGADKQLAQIVKDGNNVFNINIMLSDDMMKSKAYSDDDNKKIYNKHGDTCENVCPAKKQRIYDPIKYQQQYRGDMRYRPNVCSYGTKQIVQPVFVNSSTLFRGTDLKEASENTQVGSIMPKFEYREYEEIDTV